MLLFRIFLFLCCLLTPACMVYFGRRFCVSPPKEINSAYGYRTRRSMSSPEAWSFAHQLCGRIWRCAGWALMVPTAVVMAAMFGRSVDALAVAAIVLCTIQVVVMCAALVPVERALKREFPLPGRPKNQT